VANPSILPKLVCPESRQPLAMADGALVARLNEAVQAGRLKFAGGEPVQQRLDGGLIRQDGTLLYPIVQGIPNLTSDQAIAVDQLESGG
jgi:uncharacterized protein YbaR (Trm112 family)